MDKALAHLKSAFPLTTPEWSAWSATMRSPRIEGAWALGGYEAGEGPSPARVTITPGAAPDEFTTETSLHYARSGRTVTRSGRAVIYTGYQWRGRTTVGGDDATSLREVMLVDRDWQSITGRWFAGDYDELGLDVTLTRVGRETDRHRRSTGRRCVAAPGQTVAHLRRQSPRGARAARHRPRPRRDRHARRQPRRPASSRVDVDVAADAPIGARDLFVAGTLAPGRVAVYDKVDYIKVAPGWNMARVGGVVFPKMLAQFEAVALSHGPDGKPDTKDDLTLGAVDATWSRRGIHGDVRRRRREVRGRDRPHTRPVHAGARRPEPEALRQPQQRRRRLGGRRAQPAGSGAPMRARAHLVVTVPLYMRWDFSRVGPR